jgi:hypothetical protein
MIIWIIDDEPHMIAWLLFHSAVRMRMIIVWLLPKYHFGNGQDDVRVTSDYLVSVFVKTVAHLAQKRGDPVNMCVFGHAILNPIHKL